MSVHPVVVTVVLVFCLAASGAAQTCPGVPAIDSFGAGSPGLAGVSELVTEGAPIEGFPFSVSVQNALRDAQGLVFVGATASQVFLPEYGTSFYPSGSPLRSFSFTTDEFGSATLLTQASVDASLCGLDAVVQVVIFDPAAQGGLAFTAAKRLAFGPASAAAPVLDEVPELTGGDSVVVSGTAVQVGNTVRITGGDFTQDSVVLADGTFSALVNLQPNKPNTLFVQELFPGGVVGPPSSVTVVQDSTPPVVTIGFPPEGAILGSNETSVSGTIGDTLSGFMGLAVEVTAGGNSLPATVNVGVGSNGTFDLPTLDLGTGGTVNILVTGVDAAGNSTSVSRTVVYQPPVGAQLAFESARVDSGTVGQVLTQAIAVRASTLQGMALVGQPVRFRVIQSDGRLIPMSGGPGSLELTVLTDQQGVARAQLQLGSDAGMGNNRVQIDSGVTSAPLYFSASAQPDFSTVKLNIGSGNDQVLQAGSSSTEPLNVWVNDGQNGVGAGTPVTFTVTEGSGTISELAGRPGEVTELTVFTDMTGHAEVHYVAGDQSEVARVAATVPDPGLLPAVFRLRTIRPDQFGTRLEGVVRDNSLQGLGGTVVRLLPIDGSPSPALAVTDPDGRFRFEDLVESGSFELLVEGDTVQTIGGQPIPLDSFGKPEVRFPDLPMEVFLIEEAANVLPRPIRLPRIDTSTEVLFDGTQDVVLTIPGVEGLAVHVPAETVVTHPQLGGAPIALSISPVHVDDIPMPIPDGAAAPLAWTIQPSGASFDPPLAIDLPNMAGLPAGAVAYIILFNHDTGRFEIVAPATVSDDGALISSDSGTGISKAGWGGFAPPFPNTGDVTNRCLPPGTICFDCSSFPEVIAAQDQFAQKVAFANDLLSGLFSGVNDEFLGTPGFAAGVIGWGAGVAATGLSITACLTGNPFICLAVVQANAVSVGTALLGTVSLYLAYENSINEASNDAGIAIAELLDAAIDLGDAYVACQREYLTPIGDAAIQAAVTALQAFQLQAEITKAQLQSVYQDILDKLENELNPWIDSIDSCIADPACSGFADSSGLPPLLAQIINDWLFQVEPGLQSLIATRPDTVGALDQFVEGAFSILEVAGQLESALSLADVQVSTGGQLSGVSLLGDFVIQNVPTGSPQKVVLTSTGLGGVFYGQTEYVQVLDQGTVQVKTLVISTEPPASTVSLSFWDPNSDPVPTFPTTFTELGQSVSVQAFVELSDGMVDPVVGLSEGVTYTSSNPDIVSVDADGLAVAQGAGFAFITSTRDGAAATVKFTVAPGAVLTEVRGAVVDAAMQPVIGAGVSTSAGFVAITGDLGAFTINGHTTNVDPLRVDAQAGAMFGFSFDNAVVPEGITEVGAIVIDVDTDGDGLPDWYETNVFGCDPSLVDSDGDGLGDGVEVLFYGTSPGSGDSEGDGFEDDLEIALGSDPLQFDAPTLIAGQVFVDGLGPVDGTQVAVVGVPTSLYSTLADGGGNFSFSQPWPASLSPVAVRAEATLSGGIGYSGVSAPTECVPDGTTIIGSFSLSLTGAGEIFPNLVIPTGSGNPRSLFVGRLDDDPFDDVVVLAGTINVLMGSGNGLFGEVSTYSTSGFATPLDLTVSDMDQDGIKDLVVCMFPGVQILYGQIGGGYSDPQVVDDQFLCPGVEGLVVSDLNLDGWPDIAVVDVQDGLSTTSNDTVEILLGNGLGGFLRGASIPLNVVASSIDVGLLDSDASPDLVVTAKASGIGQVRVLLGDGEGAFTPLPTLSVGGDPRDVDVVDMNRDSNADLVVGDFGPGPPFVGGGVWVLRGDGTGTFDLDGPYVPGAFVGPITIEDLNQDMLPDVAFSADATLSVLLGVDEGEGLELHDEYASSTGYLGAGDLNSDGLADLVNVAVQGGIWVAEGLGGGGFSGAATVAAGQSPGDVSVADLDEDGAPELLVTNLVLPTPQPGLMSVLPALGGGIFGAPESYLVGESPADLHVADLNLDERQDVVVQNGTGGFFSAPTSISIFLGSPPPEPASANFGRQLSQQTESVNATQLADMNQDGIPDIVALNAGLPPDVSVWLGTGDGTFVLRGQTVVEVGGNSGAIATGFLNADAHADVVYVSNLGSIVILEGVGDGTLVVGNTYSQSPVSGLAPPVAIADLDLDGNQDFAIPLDFQGGGSLTGDSVVVYLGDGTGAFSLDAFYGVANPSSVAIGDVDLNGLPDIVVGTTSAVALFRGVGGGQFLDAQYHVTGGRDVIVADVNQDGAADVVSIGGAGPSGRVNVLENQLQR